jgi:c-di-GMP-binding flagellar brake protein YcgR
MSTQSALQQQSLQIRHDRRRYQRVRVNLLGRFMLEDRHEYPCQILDMSPGSAALITPVVGKIDERVVAYIDHIGRIEGQVARHIDGGFAMTVAATPRKREKLASQLTWLANRHNLNLQEDRRHQRITPNNPFAEVRLPDGRQFRCRIIDLSLSGAAVTLDVRPPIGSPIFLGAIRSTVVRHFEEGIGIEFVTQQTAESIEQNLG